jgi:hypothetical protein
MLTQVLAILLAVVVALFLATVFLVRKIGSAKHSLPLTAEWIDELSIDRYRPMMRLLDSRELDLLRAWNANCARNGASCFAAIYNAFRRISGASARRSRF